MIRARSDMNFNLLSSLPAGIGKLSNLLILCAGACDAVVRFLWSIEALRLTWRIAVNNSMAVF